MQYLDTLQDVGDRSKGPSHLDITAQFTLPGQPE